MNRSSFYKSVRQSLFSGTLKQSQVDGMEAILNYWDSGKYTDKRWLAYMLATVFHETAHTMSPIEEYGKGKGHKYGRKFKMSGLPYSTPDKIYYGRGFVQLTWYENYEKMGNLLGVNLLEHPELALDLEIATKIMFEGMTKGASHAGDFTGKSLEHYFTPEIENPVGARKIINGLDRAQTIAGYYYKFLVALCAD